MRVHPTGATWLAAGLLLLCGCICLHGQSASTGALEGAVRDNSESPVAGAAVTLLNPATEQKLTAATDEKGNFRFPLVPPAVYELSIAAAGFKTARMAQATVNVSEVLAIDAALEVGDAGEAVDCHCSVRTAGPSTGTLVDQKTITAVPLNTRNFTQVLSMSSGSAADVNNAGTLGRGTSSVNVNGNSTAGSYTIDGAYSPSTVPNPDTISEFKIQTSQYDSAFGAMVPSTNLMTRRGENDFHGNLWEFLRNDIFNANAFFRNATGQPKPNLKQNQFGATLGGPVIRNKWFFFGSYQGTRQVNGLDPTSVANPILPPLGSDRSAGDARGPVLPGQSSRHVPRYLTFAGGKQLDCFNRDTPTTAPINPVALRMLQAKAADGTYLIPSPQTLITSGRNAGLGFSSYSLPSTYNENHYIANSDYVLNQKHTLSGRVFTATVNQLRSFGSPGGYPGAPVVPGWGAPQALHADDVATSVRLTSTLTANVVNEATMAYTRNKTDAVGVGIPEAADFGMTAVDPLFPQAPEVTVLGPLGTFRLFGTNPNDNHFSDGHLLVVGQRLLGTRQAADSHRRFVSEPVQRPRRYRRRARPRHVPDVRRFSAGHERGGEPESGRPQQHSDGAGERRRGAVRRGGVPLPPLLRVGVRAGRHQAKVALHAEPRAALGVHHGIDGRGGHDRQRFDRR